MSVDPSSVPGAAARASLAARITAGERRREARLDAVIDDFLRDERNRLDDRTRAAIAALVDGTVRSVEREIAGHAARLLATRGEARVAGMLTRSDGGVLPRLIDAGLLRDRELMGEFVAQARVDLIDEALATNRAPGVSPTLLVQLAQAPDPIVRTRAIAYLGADSRRRLPAAERQAELPAELFHQLVWWITAALRERVTEPSPTADRALGEAAARSIAAFDEGARVEATAAQLAQAIDADADVLGELLIEALVEARCAFFVAVLAHALKVEPAEARALVLDPDGERLWIALRALGLPREALARVGWMLGEADRARDVEALPDAIEAAAAVPEDEARDAIAPLTLARDFRTAMRALARVPV